MAQEKDYKTTQVADVAAGEKKTTSGEKYTGNTKDEKWYNPKDITNYDIDSYIEKRWGDQFDYFEDRAKYNRKWYNRIQFLIILFGALSVVILSFDLDSLIGLDSKVFSLSKLLCALMSATIVILTGYDKLKQFNSEWTNKRKAQESLKTEICKFKFGVEPYASPVVDGIKDEVSSSERNVSGTVSGQTKLLLSKLNVIVEEYNENSFNIAYEAIKKVLFEFLSSTGEFGNSNGINDKINDKDKAFVSRIKFLLENCQRFIYAGNLSRVVKAEITDFYIDGGSYSPVKLPKKDSPEEISAKNERLFVARVESIVAKDVEEFVSGNVRNIATKLNVDTDGELFYVNPNVGRNKNNSTNRFMGNYTSKQEKSGADQKKDDSTKAIDEGF